MSLRILAEDKAILLRAVSLQHTDLTDFVLRHALRAARDVIEEAEHLHLSERDSLRILDLLRESAPHQTRGCWLLRRRCRRSHDRHGVA